MLIYIVSVSSICFFTGDSVQEKSFHYWAWAWLKVLSVNERVTSSVILMYDVKIKLVRVLHLSFDQQQTVFPQNLPGAEEIIIIIY